VSSKRTLIGLTGRKGAGKDTAASVLVAQGYENVKFAGALKDMIRTLLSYQGVDADTIERMIEGDLKEVPTRFLGGHTPRYAMQTLGTEWGRDKMGANFWVGTTKQKVRAVRSAGGKVVITDVRFLNEGVAVQEEGGIVYGVIADWIVPVEGEHESERQIDELIAALPDNQKINNRSAKIGESIRVVIDDFRMRFARLALT
jgi:hypothetical protein